MIKRHGIIGPDPEPTLIESALSGCSICRTLGIVADAQHAIGCPHLEVARSASSDEVICTRCQQVFSIETMKAYQHPAVQRKAYDRDRMVLADECGRLLNMQDELLAEIGALRMALKLGPRGK